MAYEEVTVQTEDGPKDIAVDQVNGKQIQVVRIDVGDGVTESPLTSPLPVSASALPLPTGAATSAAQATQTSHLATLAGAVSGSEVQVDIVSGSATGTEYTEGATDSTITGTAILWEDTSDTLRAVSAAKPLPVAAIGQAGVNPVSGQTGVAAGSGTVSANTQRIVLATDVALPAGTNYIGRVRLTDGTLNASIIDLSVNDALAVAIVDSTGAQIPFTYPVQLSATPTLGTGACVQYDSLHTTIITLSGAALINNGSGHILGGRLASKHNSFTGQIVANIFSQSVTGTTAQDLMSVSDADSAFWIGNLLFDFSRSNGQVSRVATANRSDLPMPYKCSNNQSALFVILQLWSNDTPTFAASDLVLNLLVQPD